MQNFIYLRLLRNADHTVFVVDKGQKKYYNPQFNRQLPFSGGQQVKRSIMDTLCTHMGASQLSPVTFYHEIEGGATLSQKEIHSACDPSYVDQLIGGWMRAGSDVKTVKRRSPLSISAMRPLHPLLAGVTEEAGTFDLRGRPNAKVIVRQGGKELNEAEIQAFLESKGQKNPNFLNKRIDSFDRATGLFACDIAIDLRTLFCVSIETFEPELDPEVIEKLKKEGWKPGKNVFGKCLICPKEHRDKIIPALSHALLNWRITSNQSRTFSLEEVLAVAISENANQLGVAIRSQLRDDLERPAAKPVIDETGNADIFIMPQCMGYVEGITGSANALEEAEKMLISKMKAFDYENQLSV
jgi:hypothetical protein